MKKFMALVLVITMVMCAPQVYAQESSTYGRYLMKGTCDIRGETDWLYIYADMDAYEEVDSMTIEVEVYRETSTSDTMVWYDSITVRNTDYAEYGETYVAMLPGYYYVTVIYTVKNGTVTESDSLTTDTVIVY